VVGQEHVTVPLRNAVRHGTVAHAYLFSGPRGTGKTSTARILAKALNCTDLDDGEPCGRCHSCIEIVRGASMDVHELDAASNNGVDAMRDLVARAALGTPGRSKVYIVDEVHMLSTAASNALLKTLEEPPPHVVFVLATTDPQKVLPTIRSRTQPFEFRLLGPDVLGGLLRSVRDAAGLGVDDGAVDAAVRRGRGSARDALSVLDQVAAGGLVDDAADVLDAVADALAAGDSRQALVAVARAAAAGYDPQRLAADLADLLRQVFLTAVAPETVTAPVADRPRLATLVEQMGLAAVVRAMERLGSAQVAMRDAPDPRAHLEVALVRLTTPDLDDSVASLLERLDRLERRIGAGSGSRGAVDVSEGGPPVPPEAAPTEGAGRPTLGALRRRAGLAGPRSSDDATPVADPSAPDPSTGGPRVDVPPATGGPTGRPSRTRETAAEGVLAASDAGTVAGGAPSGPAGVGDASQVIAAEGGTAEGGTAEGGTAEEPAVDRGVPRAQVADAGSATVAAPAASAAFPTRDQLVQAWGDQVLAALPSRARARFRVGRFVAADEGTAVFALPNDTHRRYCEEVRTDVEQALTGHFGVRVVLRLVVDDDQPPEGGSVGASRGGEGPTGTPRGGQGPTGAPRGGDGPAAASRGGGGPVGTARMGEAEAVPGVGWSAGAGAGIGAGADAGAGPDAAGPGVVGRARSVPGDAVPSGGGVFPPAHAPMAVTAPAVGSPAAGDAGPTAARGALAPQTTDERQSTADAMVGRSPTVGSTGREGDAAGSSSGRVPGRARSASEIDEDHEVLLDPGRLAAETALAGDAVSVAERLKRWFPGAEEA
jgi:DNA polymerase-3 subunit gamma/tau